MAEWWGEKDSREGVKILTCGGWGGRGRVPLPASPSPTPTEETFWKEHFRALRSATGMARNSVWLQQGEEGQEGVGGSGGTADGVGLRGEIWAGFPFPQPPPPSHLRGQDIRAGGGGRGGCGNCPTGATWWGKGLDSGCILSGRAMGLAIRTLPGGRGRHGCQRCSSLERWLKAQQSAPSGGWWGSPVSSPPASLPARTRVGIKTYEAASIEDATDTVRGLVMELSNLK